MLGARQFPPEIGSMVEAGHEVAVDRRHVEFCGGAAFDDRGENPVIGIVFKGENAAGTVGEDHEIPFGIRHHPRRDAATQRFYGAGVGKGRGHSRIAAGATPHSGKDSFEIGHTNQVDHFPGATKVFDGGYAEIA